jgi:hypothetical protein
VIFFACERQTTIRARKHLSCRSENQFAID